MIRNYQQLKSHLRNGDTIQKVLAINFLFIPITKTLLAPGSLKCFLNVKFGGTNFYRDLISNSFIERVKSLANLIYFREELTTYLLSYALLPNDVLSLTMFQIIPLSTPFYLHYILTTYFVKLILICQKIIRLFPLESFNLTGARLKEGDCKDVIFPITL